MINIRKCQITNLVNENFSSVFERFIRCFRFSVFMKVRLTTVNQTELILRADCRLDRIGCWDSVFFIPQAFAAAVKMRAGEKSRFTLSHMYRNRNRFSSASSLLPVTSNNWGRVTQPKQSFTQCLFSEMSGYKHPAA